MSNAKHTRAIWLSVVLSTLAIHGQASAEKIAKDEDLMPEGEKKLLDKHSIDSASAHYMPGKGLTIASKDGKFKIATRLRVQPRITVENDSGAPAEVGMLLRRARLQFAGNSFGKHNKFKAEFAFSPRDLRIKNIDGNTLTRETPLLTWYMEFDHVRDLTVRLGQYKLPFSRQRVISSGNLQMVDRSIANGEFNIDRDMGLDVRSKDLFGLGMFKYHAGIYNGEGRSSFQGGNTDFLYLARVEYLPLGMFKDYSEGDHQRLAKPGLAIGLGYINARGAQGTRVNRNGRPADGGTTDYQSAVADITFKYQGFAFSSEVFWRDGDRNDGGAVDEMGNAIATEAARNGIGWFAQAGYLLPKLPIEFTGRFGQIKAADESSLSDKSELGMAASYYFAQHPFKLQADAFQLWGDEFSDGTTQVRVQMQYSF